MGGLRAAGPHRLWYHSTMELELGRGKRARRAYGFDEVALVPGRITINPEEIDLSFSMNGTTLPVPFLAAAMDGVVDTRFAREMGSNAGRLCMGKR